MKGKQFLVGNKLSVADVVLATAFIAPFQTVLDAAFRKESPNFSNWFIKLMAEPAFIKRVGIIKPCEKALSAFNPDAKAETPAEEKKEDDDMDLFGDDDEEDAEAAKKAAEAAKAGAKKKKEKPPEMSLIILEVKPLDDQTNLDDLAKRIFA